MKKIFKQNETLFCISLIFIYLVVNSYCINNFGIYDYRSAIVNVVISLVLAPHSNVTKGKFRHRDWNDLVRSFTYFNRYLKRYPALKGFVIDSLPIMEHLLLESK
jgi:hypothetical protein